MSRTVLREIRHHESVRTAAEHFHRCGHRQPVHVTRKKPMIHRLALFPWRFTSLLDRLRWLAPLAGGPIPAMRLILQMRSSPDACHQVKFAGRPIAFRGADALVLREVFADQEYSFLAPLLERSPSPRILDVGAHIGAFAALCRSYAPDAQVLSVEADPDTFEVLQSNAQAWGGADSGWQVTHAAAGAEDGALLRLDTDGPTMSHRIDASGTVSVRSVSLKSLVERCAAGSGDIDLAKIDIEGSEEALILGQADVLQRIRALVIELHPTLCDTERVLTVLRETYTSLVEIGNRTSTKPLLYCRHNTGP